MLTNMDPQSFLADYWQKEALFLPAARLWNLPLIDPDELGWLATLADVESRLVLTEQAAGHATYRLESGPFEDARLRELPAHNWTLLVQDVEKHLPEFRRYLAEFFFIPDWRIDDLMVSCAAPGGSVGPHVDQYDVFLVQGSGTRHWTVGRPEEVAADAQTGGLALIAPFTPVAEYSASPGDVLYLPPGIPHWGVATDLCVTLSIGCRAPTRQELQLGQERVLGKPVNDGPGSDDPVFYQDPDLDLAEALPGKIDPRVIGRLREQGLLADSLSAVDLARIFGSVVTDPKAWLDPEAVSLERIDELLRDTGAVDVHGMARLAWCELADSHLVFVNGADRRVPAAVIEIIKKLCDVRRLARGDSEALRATEHGESCLAWMASKGMFDAGHSDE